MTALLLKLAPWVAGIVMLLSIGAYTGYRLNPWEARYHALQLSDAQARADGEATVRKALSEQLAQAQAISHNNQTAMVTLATQNAETATERDAVVARVHRLEQLLAAQAARGAATHQLPQAGDRSAVTGPTGDPGIDRAGELLIAARDECRRNANRLYALIAEISPQVQP